MKVGINLLDFGPGASPGALLAWTRLAEGLGYQGTDAALARGLKDGDHARVHNDRGEYRATVRIGDRVRPGVVEGRKGYWPKHLPDRANPNATVAERDADMGGGTVYHDNRVEVSAVR